MGLPGLEEGGDAPDRGEATAEGQGVARVQLEGSAALELDYAIPAALRGRLQVGARVMVPLQKQEVPAVVLQVMETSPHAKLREVLRLVGSRPMFSEAMLKLANWISEYYVAPLPTVLRTMLPQAVRKKPENFLTDSEIALARAWDDAEVEALSRRAPMQGRILEMVRAQGGRVTLSALRRELKQATGLVKSLVEKGWLSRAEVRVERDPFQDETFLPSAALTLTEEQAVCLEAVQEALKTPTEARPLLLHGVTGSGKTEVYLQAIAGVLEAGKTALVLVPEISLTPQTIERFKARYSDRTERVAVLHSLLSEGERHDEWYKIHEGKADIVIGARSAIFAPLERLGIIIVDEEHEPS
ncbi:MAG: DEAD/DEAH box helicase family protein, partial [Verrucomicrobiales bacterium]|nr:DEAD/DEAH box helicase family protein [Verrucomicrobiales bacterium]